ncbi:hypothetical protein Btru_021301 [Bulinus truncatus]|nr:hypothetical protein Btru_021301 [Bulinus truncatus]
MGICFLISWTWICLMSFCVGIIDGNVCPPNMKFHKHTKTCMIYVKRVRSYSDAESYCKTTYNEGHLVYILDKETDDFIKSVLY